MPQNWLTQNCGGGGGGHKEGTMSKGENIHIIYYH